MAAGEELPACKESLPARAEICQMGWKRFQSWGEAHLVRPEPTEKACLARYFRDLRDEATAKEEQALPEGDVQKLEQAYQDLTLWLRARATGQTDFPLSQWEAELAEVKHQCVQDWGQRPPAQEVRGWPKPRLTSGPETEPLRKALDGVRRLKSPARQYLQAWSLRVP